MKLPIIHSGSGGGSSYHTYNDQTDPMENELDQDELNTSNENTEVDFTEYMWMEHEEEFDKLEMNRLEEEALIEECMENMQEDDQDDAVEHEHIYAWQINYDTMSQEFYNGLSPVQMVVYYDIENSKLNPLAKEFVPSSVTH